MIRKQTRKWTQKNGEKIRICDMSDGHLLNTIRMLKRVGLRNREEALYMAAYNCQMVSADMASYYASQELDNVTMSTWEDFAGELFDDMMEDARRRGGDVEKRAEWIVQHYNPEEEPVL